MGTLYLDRRDLSLRLDGKRLVIEEPDARPRGVPLALVERAVFQGSVRFDSGVLAALAEQGSSVVCLSARHSRRTALLLVPVTATPAAGWRSINWRWTRRPACRWPAR